MDHKDHVFLLRKGVGASQTGHSLWADFGSGRGAFTLALAELLGPNGVIYSVDKSRSSLQQQERAMEARYPETEVQYLVADFDQKLELSPLDGLVMANSLHFIRSKERVVRLLRSYLRPGGRFVLVEYNTDRGNHWVPHPLSYGLWEKLARRVGFEHTELMATVPSSFLGEFYAAASWD